MSIKPLNIGGPFALNFAITSAYGNYNTIQGNITVTAPVVVPVDKVLAGTIIAGQTGTMVNKVGSGTVITPGSVDQVIPQGFYGGAFTDGKVKGVIVPAANVLSGTTIAGQAGTMANKGALTIVPGKDNKSIPAGYHNGSGLVSGDPDLIASNIKSGVNIYGVVGTLSSSPTHGTQTYSTPGAHTFTVPEGVTQLIYIVVGGGGQGGGTTLYSYAGGGGGSGGLNINSLPVTPGQQFTVVVGAGGTGGTASTAPGGTGGDSSFDGNIAQGGYGGYCALTSSGSAGGGGGAGGGIGTSGRDGMHGTWGSGGPGGNGASGTLDGYGGGGKGAFSTYNVPGTPGTNGKVSILW